MKEDLVFTLKEISEWVKPGSLVDIPALQRGLVWKPRQVELLWDSLLRGFPIGSFMLSDVVDGQSNAKYYLMDGQQRFNAISLGFNNEENANAMLWIDVNPPKDTKNSTRTYWIKATTDAHPWGFHNNDECSILNTAEKRAALSKFGFENKNNYQDIISIHCTWPSCAGSPIPLSFILSASTDNSERFANDIQKQFDSFNPPYPSKYKEHVFLNIDYIKKTLYDVFKRLKDYKVGCCHLPLEVLKNETEEDRTDQTALEVLFNRINTGGTRISQDDLNYSAIKAYWPNIKIINDKLAKRYMNPSKLVMLCFRLAALLYKNDGKWVSDFSIKQIRSLAKDEKRLEEKKAIEELYKEIDKILIRIDEWLGVIDSSEDRTPALLRTSIAYNSPDVYLLLMYFARKSLEGHIMIDPTQVKALAFSLHWFGTYKRCAVEEIYKICYDSICKESILKGISQSLHGLNGKCYILPVYSPDEVKKWYTNQCSPEWNFSRLDNVDTWIDFFNRVFRNGSVEACEMLLYAQRQYINKKFQNYDPARRDLWEDYNRPWDLDHIIPRDWIDYQQGKYREFDKIWLNSIGNFAAISFEINRGKGNREEFGEYEEFSEQLLFDELFETIPNNITHDDKKSALFARITFERFLKIYNETYKIIKCLFDQVVLPQNLIERKQLFTKIMEATGAKAYFATAGGKEFEVVREQDWAREWIGVGVVLGDYYASLEWSAVKDENGNPTNVEIGIRKAPSSHITQEKRDVIKELKGLEAYQQETNNGWWYYWRDGSKLIKDHEKDPEIVQTLIDEIHKIASLLENRLKAS